MTHQKETVVVNRIELLRKREAQLKAAILAEETRLQEKRDREHQKLAWIVGDTLLLKAEETPSLKIMLRQVLSAAILDGKRRAFLAQRGWM